MVPKEEVTQDLEDALQNVGPPLAEDGHSEDAESSLDPDLVEDLIPDEDVESSSVEEVTQPKVRPLDWEFFSSVRDYIKGLPSFRADKPLPGVVTNNRHDQDILTRFLRGKKLSMEETLPKVLGYDLSEPSLTVSNGGGEPHKIPFRTVTSNPNFFLRLSDPSSYEHKKSLFLWRAVTYIRSLILNPNLLRSVLEEVRSYIPKPGNERMTKQFDSKIVKADTQEKELQFLLMEARWTEHFLVSVKGSNVLARQIWHALRGVPTGLMEDVLEELRTRFKRGRIWEDDPWWPNDR